MKIVGCLMAMLLALGVSAHAADEKKSDKKAEPEKKTESVFQAAVPEKKDETVKVWTNADLDGLGNKPFATTPSAAASVDRRSPDQGAKALEWLQDRERSVQTRSERIAAAQAVLDSAEWKLANLEKQLLATVNPFSARPKLSEAEIDERRTVQETAEERFKRTRQVTDDARAEVEAARANLQRTKAGR